MIGPSSHSTALCFVGGSGETITVRNTLKNVSLFVYHSYTRGTKTTGNIFQSNTQLKPDLSDC